MRLLQFLFLISGFALLNPVIADDEGGDYEAAPVSYIAPEQDDAYDDGDYGAAPLSWGVQKKVKKPAKVAKKPKPKAVTKISKPQQKDQRQRWAKLEAGADAFE